MLPTDVIFLTIKVLASSNDGGAHFPTGAISIAVAVVAALGAWASQRAASKATTVSARMDAEKDAYERARQLDTETINRLRDENAELRKELEESRRETAELRGKVDLCNENILRLQDRFPISIQGLEGLLNERASEEKPSTD